MKRIQKPTIQKLFGGVFVAQLKHIAQVKPDHSPQKVVKKQQTQAPSRKQIWNWPNIRPQKHLGWSIYMIPYYSLWTLNMIPYYSNTWFPNMLN